MKIVVQLFAGAHQLAGQRQVEVELAPAATVGQLRTALAATCPALAPLLPHALFAINAQYATDEVALPPAAEIACIPPVSGG
jgi:molybdopterin synthase catalytic subunit/molybdopterin synthase sulfur carrier subunit